MKKLKVKDIINATKGELICGNTEDICEDFERDSRLIEEGKVYVAIKGENNDGNIYTEQAIKNGAKCCIINEDIEKIIKEEEVKEKIKLNQVNIIKVKNTIKALQQTATYKRTLYDIPVVAVTGSVGKTSTKDIIASVMNQKYKTYKTQGNLNNHIGLPLTVLSLKEHEALVIEMGMNHLGEISELTQIAKPTLAVITNIGTAHIGNLGSRENILKAKLEILEGLQGNTVIINNDNDLLAKWAEEQNKYNVITYGINNKNSKYVAENIEQFDDRSTFTIKDEKITVPVGGEHFVLNSLCAIAVGEQYNIDMKDIKKGIEEFELTKSRMEVIKSKIGATLINDCYNANYDSMKAAINYLESIKEKRRIAVLGDMLELGEFSQKIHEEIGKEIKDIDVLITIGKEAKNIAKNATAKEIYEFDNNQEAIKKLEEIITPNDIILLKASNSMNFEEIAKAL